MSYFEARTAESASNFKLRQLLITDVFSIQPSSLTCPLLADDSDNSDGEDENDDDDNDGDV